MNVTCHQCGAPKRIEGSFWEVNRFLRTSVLYCPVCWALRRRFSLGAFLRAAFLVALIVIAGLAAWAMWIAGLAMYGNDYWQRVGVALLNIVINLAIACLALLILTVLHELGHAACARLLGWHVAKIGLGWGRLWGQFRFAGFLWDIHRELLSGGVAWTAPKSLPGYRWKFMLIVVAGPLVHLVLLAPLLLFPVNLQPFSAFAQEPAPWRIFVAINLLMLAGSLLPYQYTVNSDSGAMSLASDGLVFFQTFFASAAAAQQHHAAYYVLQGNQCLHDRRSEAARAWYEKGLATYPDDFGNAFGRATSLLMLKDFQGSRDHKLALLERKDLSAQLRTVLLNNIAWVDLLLGADFLDEAERFSLEAFEADPKRAPYQGTRGSVLIERGDLEEGLLLVRLALEGNSLPQLKALNACYLAIGESKRGNRPEAERMLALARTLDADAILLEKAETAMRAAHC